MKNDLIDRYIYAVAKRLPASIRKDVSDELDSLISDMLDERCGEVTPTEKDVRVVLIELGTPKELADRYNTDKDKCVIGSPYYSTYIFVLKVVLICTGAGMLMSGIINIIIGKDLVIAEEIFNILFMIISGMMTAFSFVTLIFMFLYHKNIKLDVFDDSLDNLPPVPKKSSKISKIDSISGIVISVIFAVLFLTIPQIFGIYLSDEFITIFNVEAIHSVWYLIVIFSLIGIVKGIIRLIDSEYTLRVLVSTIIADILTALLSVIWLVNDNMINSELAPKIIYEFIDKSQNGADLLSGMLENFNKVFLVVIIFALLLDITVTVIEWCKSNKEK